MTSARRLKSVQEDSNSRSTRRVKPVKPKNAAQSAYLEKIEDNALTFGLGMAGTGKTYLAVAKAVEFLKGEDVQRLILIRPTAVAGEEIGFLPGTAEEKLDPYMKPLFDALYDIVGQSQVDEWKRLGKIEVAPLGFLRGRTFNDCFVILDEAQNATFAQLKLVITRMGYGTTMVITGDPFQSDIPDSGLTSMVGKLKAVDNVASTTFKSSDIVRSPILAQIIEAMEA